MILIFLKQINQQKLFIKKLPKSVSLFQEQFKEISIIFRRFFNIAHMANQTLNSSYNMFYGIHLDYYSVTLFNHFTRIQRASYTIYYGNWLTTVGQSHQ
ncbi:unnamed protein product [Paramecium sonneborni]|uniref:Uncharacterized protein n=1 Tax=Paramecium sonneborni TaxID=65129 RepID=A0A8S1QVZ2_9CILI|nr:unnamed protein product [Paramecium sonneborni]